VAAGNAAVKPCEGRAIWLMTTPEGLMFMGGDALVLAP